MHSLERGKLYESLDHSVSRLAYAYGFMGQPVSISRKTTAGTSGNTGASLALIKSTAPAQTPTQVWGTARGPKGSSTLSFAVVASRHPAAHALVIEVSRAIIGITGMRDVTVLVSSVGDQESKRRFARELVNFFRKRNGDLPLELRHEAARDPERTYQMLDERNDPLIADTPHRIDHLSENSRKVMLDTLALFESTSIPYAIEPRLPANPNEHAELLFALEASDRRGNRIKVAAGGRFDEYLKRAGRDEAAVAISISVPSHIEPEAVDQAPMCFVVHVGDVAKLKLFLILRGLWESELLIGQILMLGTLREQMDAARARGAHYIAIVGQREALDGTVIVRNVATQLQTVIPAGKLVSYLEHKT